MDPPSVAERVTMASDAQILRPALVVALAIALLSVMDAMVKGFGTAIPVVQIVFLRYLAGSIAALPVFLATRPHVITRERIRANGLRAAIMLVAAGCFFYAVTRLPLVEAVALAFTAPLFMVLVARLVLQEPIRSQAVAGVALGLLGVLLVLGGDGSGDTPKVLTPDGIAAALVSALAYAFGIVLLRKHSASTPIVLMVSLQAFIATAIMLPVALLAWQPVGTGELARFAVIGCLGTSGHLLMAWGFARAEAGRLAPIEYTNFIWAVAIGYLVFSEEPALATYLGAGAIMLACAVATRKGWPVYPRRRYTTPDEERLPPTS